MGISSIIEPYLANHLSAVMGPVQLSELSQELKPAPEEAGRRQCREDLVAVAPGEGLAGQLGEGCLANTAMSLSLGSCAWVKLGVGLNRRDQGRRCCGGLGIGKAHCIKPVCCSSDPC